MPRSLTNLFDDLPTVKIVDVGAAVLNGKVDYQAIVDVGKADIIGFDGDGSAAEEASKHFGGGARIYPHLVGNGEPAVFHENVFAPTSSLFPVNKEVSSLFTQLPEILETVKETPVETIRLDDIEEIDGADALFIDVQGSELDVITHAKRVMKDVLVVHTEVEFIELYKGQPLFSDLDPVIRGHDMMFHKFFGLSGRPFAPVVIGGDKNRNMNNHLWSDAVYISDPRRFDELCDDQLLKLALLMNDVYGSVDVAFIALQAYDRRNETRRAGDYMGFLSAPS